MTQLPSKNLPSGTPLQEVEALQLHILHTRPASTFFLQKLFHIGVVTHTSSIDSVRVTMEFLQVSTRKSTSLSYTELMVNLNAEDIIRRLNRSQQLHE